MKIAVYAIAKNEGPFIDRFMASAADADCVHNSGYRYVAT